MKLNKFTFKAQEVLQDAQNTAEENHQSEITPEHLLLALMQQRLSSFKENRSRY